MTRPPTEVGPKQSPALRGSVRLRITHTRQTRTDNIGERPRALLTSGAGDWKARGIAKPEPIMRPRLYNIAHSAGFHEWNIAPNLDSLECRE
jgi:hypothetical protein